MRDFPTLPCFGGLKPHSPHESWNFIIKYHKCFDLFRQMSTCLDKVTLRAIHRPKTPILGGFTINGGSPNSRMVPETPPKKKQALNWHVLSAQRAHEPATLGSLWGPFLASGGIRMAQRVRFDAAMFPSMAAKVSDGRWRFSIAKC